MTATKYGFNHWNNGFIDEHNQATKIAEGYETKEAAESGKRFFSEKYQIPMPHLHIYLIGKNGFQYCS